MKKKISFSTQGQRHYLFIRDSEVEFLIEEIKYGHKKITMAVGSVIICQQIFLSFVIVPTVVIAASLYH